MRAKRQLMVLKIGDEEFALDILLTKEVIGMREITPVPESPDYVPGVLNLRGNLIPVLDLRKRLRCASIERHKSERIVVTSLDGFLAGLLVDGASELIRVDDSTIEQPPEIISEMGIDYIVGIINLAGRFITLMDLKKALTGEVAYELERVVEAMKTQRQPVASPPLRAIEA
jgi:purine-binding chemotaxis protein CheW